MSEKKQASPARTADEGDTGDTVDHADELDNADSPAEIPGLVVDKAKAMAQAGAFQAQIFKAIAVQRPVVLEYLRTVRRDKPNASPGELLKELDTDMSRP